MRALILYPMNALVEDQLVRLRKALDSSEARDVMDGALKGNRIFFGRYTGATPVTGHNLHPGLEPLLSASKKSLENSAPVYFPDHSKADEESGYVAQADIRSDELRRRQRKLGELFDHMVDAEEGQRQARLYAWEQDSLEKLEHLLEEYGKSGTELTPQAFWEMAKGAGRFGEETIRREFEERFDRPWTPEDRNALQEVFFTESVDLSGAPSSVGDETPFAFPAIDGAEMSSRWDMQAHPPDILITNVSMLSAMLNREIDAPLFEKTRDWLESNEEARFHLVLDELHLQRGAAGTELAYLLRLLLNRLGLSKPDQRHKVRVLASSASLPAAPPSEAEKSANFLWDMFGTFGLKAELDEEGAKKAWLDSIVGGREVGGRYSNDSAPSPVDPGPFVSLLHASIKSPAADPNLPFARPAQVGAGEPPERLWLDVAQQLGSPIVGELREIIRGCVDEAANRLHGACWHTDEQSPEGRTRATPVSEIAERLFGAEARTWAYERRLETVRAFLFVRGAGDGLKHYLGTWKTPPPSFRVHTFFRSIEGLYAPVLRGAGSPETPSKRVAEVGVLTIDREPRIEVVGPDGAKVLRLFELVYCECCGELMVGGLKSRFESARSRYVAELLPHEPELDGLPDKSASHRFEDLSWEQYGLFWPSEVADDDVMDDRFEQGNWIPAALERSTGGILRVGNGPSAKVTEEQARTDERYTLGRYYHRSQAQDRHHRGRGHPATNVPYNCPKCGTSYAQRSREYRLSPIRNFRAGFGKTSQLLATELFDAQRSTTRPASSKLVAFSDSRQDAAKAALSIERGHHQDIRRELLLLCLREAIAVRPSPDVLKVKLAEIQASVSRAIETGQDFTALAEENARLTTALDEARETSIGLWDVLEEPSLDALGGTGREVRRFIAEHVKKGIHPYDDAGKHQPRGMQAGEDKDRYFDWVSLFEIHPARPVRWRDSVGSQDAFQNARANLVSRVYRALTEVVFSKTYFSFEEAGQGYASVSMLSLPAADRTPERVLELAGLIRVLADDYRYRPSPYETETNPLRPLRTLGQASARVSCYAEASWPADPAGELERSLENLGRCGHENGIISVPRLRFELVDGESNFLRCEHCGRVHLHGGTGVCTRCFKPLESARVESVRAIHARSFLARRVARVMEEAGDSFDSVGSFRLHCEELTGQTEDPANRQRQFRGIFVPQWKATDEGDEGAERVLQDVDKIFRARVEIDLLTVTTTMEVGIDIGPLQAVVQSNMPPERFNYQQRVGRAGRRGQAFSMALTLCRTRSHDLYYFRHPKRMTGDIPPPPFLTKSSGDIALRFLYKGWLSTAFGMLREETRSSGTVYPADLMSPSDIHGEFLPSSFFPNADDGTDWRTRVQKALDRAQPDAIAVADALVDGSQLDLANAVDPKRMLDVMESLVSELPETGLAHTLAERGYLPMFGMPTRIRDMYLGLRRKRGRPEWRKVSRDLDLAIYEFAPGSSIVLDKEEHLAVGLTPSLAPPLPPRRKQPRQLLHTFQDRPFGQGLWMLECGHCHAWLETAAAPDVGTDMECVSCSRLLSPERAQLCWVPNAFRTDFQPLTRQDDAVSGVRHRSIQAEGRALTFERVESESDGVSLTFSLALDPRGRTYRLNRGGVDDNGEIGFNFREGVQAIRWGGQAVDLPFQAISGLPQLEARVKEFEGGAKLTRVWLTSPKTTDSLFVSPGCNPEGLSLHQLPTRTDAPSPAVLASRWLGVRAAALSGAYMLVNRASIELDIDPEQFDVLEPRRYGPADSQLPMLQITDHLVNGAGFCRRLFDPGQDGTRGIERTMSTILSGNRTRDEILDAVGGDLEQLPYPHNEFLADNHKDCDSACYKCLFRYGNQPFHGLLDWQLGGAFLRALTDPTFKCGLDGDFDFWALERWPSLAERLAAEMAERFSGETGEFEGVQAFRVSVPGGRCPWVLVAHPLWDWDDDVELETRSILSLAREEANEFGEPLCWDTFNLDRRQVQVREWIRGSVV